MSLARSWLETQAMTQAQFLSNLGLGVDRPPPNPQAAQQQRDANAWECSNSSAPTAWGTSKSSSRRRTWTTLAYGGYNLPPSRQNLINQLNPPR